MEIKMPWFTGKLFLGIFLLGSTMPSMAQDDWYTEGDYAPKTRMAIVLTNTLAIERLNCPIAIQRKDIPIQALHEMWVTVVDPSLPPNPEPTAEMLVAGGGHLIRGERNGHQIFRQLDDLDKDGIWDELFFITNFKANETKLFYVYIGFSQRGWNEHGTHAAIGSYCRHLIPFWESGDVGWKLWYPTDCDVYGKRKNMLMSYELYMKNLNGYAVPYESGSDIMTVANSFGGGGICLFEFPQHPDSVSRPRFAPVQGDRKSDSGWNEDPVADSRYAYDVVVNGPLRSMILVKTMNWHTGKGSYELEQRYTAYQNQNYSSCRVKFLRYHAKESRTMPGCGIRKNGREFDHYQKDGVVLTIGDEEIADPDDKLGAKKLHVDYVGSALVVKDALHPQFRFIPGFAGNYAFAIPAAKEHCFEYLIFAAWSEGSLLKKPAEFKEYVIKTALEYNNPVLVNFKGIEHKQ
jgi:hypothetical protein